MEERSVLVEEGFSGSSGLEEGRTLTCVCTATPPLRSETFTIPSFGNDMPRWPFASVVNCVVLPLGSVICPWQNAQGLSPSIAVQVLLSPTTAVAGHISWKPEHLWSTHWLPEGQLGHPGSVPHS